MGVFGVSAKRPGLIVPEVAGAEADNGERKRFDFVKQFSTLLVADDGSVGESGERSSWCSTVARLLCCCCCCCCRSRSKEGAKAKWSPLRIFVHRLVKSTAFNNFILGIIIFNSVLITLQMVDSTNLAAAYYFDVCDKVLMGIYILELSLKLFAHQSRFLESGWNIFDAFIVSISIIETAVYTALNNVSSISPAIFRLFRVFKALRAMRAMRAVSFLSNLQVIIVTLLKSIPAMGSIMLLLMLILYAFAIIFVTLYQQIIPQRFGNLWLAMFSLFQIITLDDWGEYYYVVYADNPDLAPQLMLLLSVFIVLETFICVNLFIAVIVNNLERANLRERQKKKRRQELAVQEAVQKGSPSRASALRRKRRKKRERRANSAAADGGSAATAGFTNRKHSKGSHGKGAPDSSGRPDSDDEEDAAKAKADKMARLKTPSEAFLHDPTLPLWQRELQPEILALIAALDHNVNLMHSHQCTLDDLVDVTVNRDPQSGTAAQEGGGGRGVVVGGGVGVGVGGAGNGSSSVDASAQDGDARAG